MRGQEIRDGAAGTSTEAPYGWSVVDCNGEPVYDRRVWRLAKRKGAPHSVDDGGEIGRS